MFQDNPFININLIDELIDNDTNQLIFFKDTSSIYQNCNVNYARKFNLLNPREIIGSRDLTLNPQHCELYFRDDQRVFKNENPITIFNPATYYSNSKIFVEGELRPVIDSKHKVVGLLGILEERDNLLSGSFLNVMNFLLNNNLANFLKDKQYLVDVKYNISISGKELSCYFYSSTLRLTAKHISSIMNLSPRTVEKYIERVKQCCSHIPLDKLQHHINTLVNRYL